MKKKLFVLTFAALAIVSFISKNNSLQSKSEILNSNVEAIASPDDPTWFEMMTMIMCFNEGGNYNMASVCQETGFYYNQKCKVTGQLTVSGVTLNGDYRVGQKYDVPWARYTCVASEGNCCLKQGLYTGNTQLA